MGSLDMDESLQRAMRKRRRSRSRDRHRNGDNSKIIGDKFTKTLYTYMLQALENEAKEKDQTMKQLASALKAQQRAAEVRYIKAQFAIYSR